MSLKPQPSRPMPEDLARLGELLLPAESPYRLIGERLYARYANADFLDLYHVEGKPALPPVDLLFVLAFQAMEDLSDRAAADALRLRLDWKYALHLPLDAQGFNFSVLSDVRERLVRHAASARLFDRLLDDLRDLGVLKRRGRQRTDSLAVHTRARHLNRLELVVETLRLAVQALIAAGPAWSRATIPPTWAETYGQRAVAERLSDADRARMQRDTGRDGQWLLHRLAEPTTPDGLDRLPQVAMLRTVWTQQDEERDDTVVFRELRGYDGTTQIQTPHDPEARWSKKRDQTWVGDKLQVSETDDADMPHLITDIALTSSVERDTTALAGIAERQEARDVLPAERFVDQGYVSGGTLEAAAQHDEDLIGPASTADPSPQARMADGITQAPFQLDLEARVATCPAGATAQGRTAKDGTIRFRFDADRCGGCALRPRCCTGKGGRRLTTSPGHAALVAARARQQTEAFKVAYRTHRGGVEGCLSALVRSHGIRVNRYIGRAKNHLRALFVGVGVNLRRTARWLAGVRPPPPRNRLAQVLTGA
ncbi:transposase [Candidatus Chloroploca sp. M-50]|uniref:Transposase n=1 Tax=Candidatus Chloroploca mongolica TaxID=2528176 RepID=A0ABS4DEX2_9CHLR|nr:transposase [Candidatus Chloroploca mongolica]MBP1467909.1 transposase [Candidatus Chloroploca mongolica]